MSPRFWTPAVSSNGKTLFHAKLESISCRKKKTKIREVSSEILLAEIPLTGLYSSRIDPRYSLNFDMRLMRENLICREVLFSLTM